MPTVKKIDDKIKWNNFLLSQPTQTGIFLQSSEWLDFQETIGHKTYRLALVEDNQILALCGIVENNLPLGKKYLYCPRGPIENIKYQISGIWYEELLREILRLAGKEKNIFFRFEPINSKSQILNTKYEIQNTQPIQPPRTLILDLTKPENDLLAAMHEKTRYNIRLAQKKNLTLLGGEAAKNSFDDFGKLIEETTKRDKFRAHPKKYYQTMLGEIRGDGKNGMRVDLKIVYSEKSPAAAAIISYFGDTVTYLHGASSYEYRDLMAPHFLHWEIIKEAKRLGYKFYDFWGIDEVKWPGVTRFKKGFAREASPDQSVGSGHIINYPGTFDLPINKLWYKIYRLAKNLSKPS